MGSSPTRGSSFFLGKVTVLGVLCYFALFVCLTLLASFFLPSHLSFKNMYIKELFENHAFECECRITTCITTDSKLMKGTKVHNPSRIIVFAEICFECMNLCHIQIICNTTEL